MNNIRFLDYKKKEYELCNQIRELSQELDNLQKTGKDITEICEQLETVLKEFGAIRKEFRQGFYYTRTKTEFPEDEDTEP